MYGARGSLGLPGGRYGMAGTAEAKLGAGYAHVFTEGVFILIVLALVDGRLVSVQMAQRWVCLYLPGVTPVARKNARVKLACDEKPAFKAICASDNRPALISVMACSSRNRLT